MYNSVFPSLICHSLFGQMVNIHMAFDRDKTFIKEHFFNYWLILDWDWHCLVVLTGRHCVSVGVDTRGWAGRRNYVVRCFLLPPDVSIQILCPVSMKTYINRAINTLQYMPLYTTMVLKIIMTNDTKNKKLEPIIKAALLLSSLLLKQDFLIFVAPDLI